MERKRESKRTIVVLTLFASLLDVGGFWLLSRGSEGSAPKPAPSAIAEPAEAPAEG